MSGRPSPTEEQARMGRALELTKEAIALTDHLAPSAHSRLVSAAIVLKAMVASRADRGYN